MTASQPWRPNFRAIGSALTDEVKGFSKNLSICQGGITWPGSEYSLACTMLYGGSEAVNNLVSRAHFVCQQGYEQKRS